MPNELRTINAKTERYRDLEGGAIFRFLGQQHPQDVWLKTAHHLSGAINLADGEWSSATPDAPIYRIKRVTIIAAESAYVANTTRATASGSSDRRGR